MNVNDLKTSVERLRGKKDSLKEKLKDTKKRWRKASREVVFAEEAQVFIQTVSQETQEMLKYRLEELVSLALSGVFQDPYQMEVRFVQRRGKTEAELVFLRKGEYISPMEGCGGGVSDVVSFALQVSLWAIKRNRPTMILDEPLKYLKGGELPSLGSSMIKEVSEDLGLQIIMVSHSPELIESSDKVIKIAKDSNHISNIETLNQEGRE